MLDRDNKPLVLINAQLCDELLVINHHGQRRLHQVIQKIIGHEQLFKIFAVLRLQRRLIFFLSCQNEAGVINEDFRMHLLFMNCCFLAR